MLIRTMALLMQTFRADVRQFRTHLLRGACAAAVLAMLMMTHDGIRWLSAPGLYFFSTLAFVSLILLSMCGAFFFSTVITEEKEQQTLGLLRMAGVGPGTLLVGKSLGRLSIILLLMMVTLPYWWLAVTLGGLTWRQVAAATVVLASHLILVSQIGTFCSVVFRTTGRSSVASLGVIVGLMIGPFILYALFSGFGSWSTPLSQFFLELRSSIAPVQLSRVLDPGYRGGLIAQQTVVNVLGGMVLFGLSWLLFDWLNTYALVEDLSSSKGLLPLRRRSQFRRRRPPSETTEGRAITWKDYHQFVGGRTGMRVRVCIGLVVIGLALGLLYLLAGIGVTNGDLEDALEAIGVSLMACIPFVAAMDALYLAGHLYQQELRQETWDTLRVLPMSLGRLCTSKLRAAGKSLIPWVSFFLLGCLCAYDEGPREFFREFEQQPLTMFFVVCYCFTLTIYALYLVCLFSLKTNPWLAIVLAGGVWFLTCFTGLFCTMELMDLDRPSTVFGAFLINCVVVGTIVIALHHQIAVILRGDREIG